MQEQIPERFRDALRPGHIEMRRITLSWGLALVLLAPAGLATAQVSLRGAQTGSGLPAASVATSPRPAETPAIAIASEPKSMAGMLAAQNDARARLNLAPLTWSSELMTRAEETVRAASQGACSQSMASEIGAANQASVYWAPPVRRMDGAGIVQDIMPSFLVTKWKAGRADYDVARSECRKSGACEQYARMVAPRARALGCAKAVCNSNAQVWACQYSGSETAPTTGLRPRQGD